MHLKQKGHCFGVLLIYTITTTALFSVGWCEPNHSPQPDSHAALHNVRNSVLTTEGLLYPSSREDGKRQRLDSRQGEPESTSLPVFYHLESRDGTRTKSSAGRPEQRIGPRMATPSSDKSLKNHRKPKQTNGEWTYSSPVSSKEDCSKGEIKNVIHGKFYIIGQLEPNIANVGYQSDSSVSVQTEGDQARIRGQRPSSSEESWQRLQPVVECGDDAMTLVVRRRRAVQLQLDRANESSVPLSQLPPQCGYSVQATWRDLRLMAQYDACHVTQEDDNYVLPLLWRGTPVKMSCPVSQMQSHVMGLSSLCCSLYGMTVKVQGLSATEELRINVRGEWTPLALLAEECGFTFDRQDAEIVIAAPYLTCGITVKDGKYTLSLQIGEKTFTLSCPVSPLEELPPAHQRLVDSLHHLSRDTAELTPTLEPFLWAPPFYLAPPYYPHPTYHHKYPKPNVHDGHNLPTPPSSTTDPIFSPHPLPPVDSQPDYPEYESHHIPVREYYKQFSAHSSLSPADEMEDSSQVYSELQQKQETPDLGLAEKHSATHFPSLATSYPVQVEAPSLQPPSHVFNPYYHYYHHPKIPLPGPTQDPDPGPEVPSINSHTHEFLELPPNVQQSEASSDQFPQPVPEAYIFPTSPQFVHQVPSPHALYPQPHPYHYLYYFPHISRGEAKRLAPLQHDMAAKTNLSYIHPLSRSSVFPGDGDVKPELDDRKRHSTPVSPVVQPPLPRSYPPKPDPAAAPSPEQPSFPNPPNHNPPPYPYYYHPYYHYHQMYFGPQSLKSTDKSVSPTLPEEPSDPLLQASYFPLQHPSYRKHQTTSSPTESANVQNSHIQPYYYYYHPFYQPQVFKDNQDLHPAGSEDSDQASSKSESQLPSDSDHSSVDVLAHAAEAGYHDIPWSPHSPFHSFYSHYMTQQLPRDPFVHPGEEEAEQRLDDGMRDGLSANTPSASPCGIGPVSDFDFSGSLGCCTCPVKDCTVGQYFVFAVPASVVEPTVAPPAHPSEDSTGSCTLQRLTSDPDIYIVPLDGCGVSKHVFGQTVVYMLEVQGFHSLQQDHRSVQEHSPIRLMVECSSSSGSPGEVRLYVMDQPPPPPIQSTPATVTVQLRIATDESFTSFHPEAHLPLSLVRGRPLYFEVSLLDPPEPDLVLLVHSCLAYTQSPYTSWMPLYNGCPSGGDSQLLPSPRFNPHHIRKIIIPSFLSLPSESSSYMAKGGYSLMDDPEIYFSCLAEACSAADGDCTVGCISSPNSDVRTMK
ncbi:uncharacterized protein LOC121198293 [Toxotes jaculatrix]|uniref:uncharacterized protein LOC121198293 n=1 Tax=Toxotes jaculatrix TaxID=941984 RepID=UPI001B3ABDF6|nr:uncharacterized protein LOC121198293 [Toxotes jaculatrix]